jgi:uncharacterized membrane protein YedE/YeeE
MKRLLIASGVAGVLFGLGLAVSGMTDASKVLAFLDISGRWDPSLLFVLGGAVAITAGATRLVLRRQTPLLDDAFHISSRRAIDPSLIFGSAIFGIGWGISGYCPGPGVALLASPSWETWAFLPAMLVGIAAHRFGRTLLSHERDNSGGAQRSPA